MAPGPVSVVNARQLGATVTVIYDCLPTFLPAEHWERKGLCACTKGRGGGELRSIALTFTPHLVFQALLAACGADFTLSSSQSSQRMYTHSVEEIHEGAVVSKGSKMIGGACYKDTGAGSRGPSGAPLDVTQSWLSCRAILPPSPSLVVCPRRHSDHKLHKDRNFYVFLHC